MNTGTVCVLDALATKGVWSIDEPTIYLEKMERIHNKLEEMQTYLKSLSSIMIMEYLTFSDTIIITLHPEGYPNEAIIPYFVRIIDGLYSHCLAESLFMRGAISYGKFIKKSNIIIGPAIDDAAYWHDKAQLIGCVLTPNATLMYDSGINYVNRNPHEEGYDYSQHAIKYLTPFKDNKSYDLYNVNWPLSFYKTLSPLGEPDPLTRLKSTLGEYPIPADAYSKHLNTIAFFNDSIAKRSC